MVAHASTAAELSTGRGAFQKHFFFMLRRPRVTLSPRRSASTYVTFPGARLRLAALFHCNLQSEKTTQSKLSNCINKTYVSRKNKGKQAAINIFNHDFLYFYIIFRGRLGT